MDERLTGLPPRHLKSLLASVAFPAWCLGHKSLGADPLGPYAQDLAGRLSRDCRHILASDWYRQIFPATRLSPQRAAMPEFETTAQGCRLATSVGGVLTGRGADPIIIDDPLKPQPASLSLYRPDQPDFWAGPASRSVDRARRAPFRVARYDRQICACRLIGLGAALSQSRSVPSGVWYRAASAATVKRRVNCHRNSCHRIPSFD